MYISQAATLQDRSRQITISTISTLKDSNPRKFQPYSSSQSTKAVESFCLRAVVYLVHIQVTTSCLHKSKDQHDNE